MARAYSRVPRTRGDEPRVNWLRRWDGVVFPFHRPHRSATYATYATYTTWAASVPPDLRFAVRLPREISHTRKLMEVEEPQNGVTSLTPALSLRGRGSEAIDQSPA